MREGFHVKNLLSYGHCPFEGEGAGVRQFYLKKPNLAISGGEKVKIAQKPDKTTTKTQTFFLDFGFLIFWFPDLYFFSWFYSIFFFFFSKVNTLAQKQSFILSQALNHIRLL